MSLLSLVRIYPQFSSCLSLSPINASKTCSPINSEYNFSSTVSNILFIPWIVYFSFLSLPFWLIDASLANSMSDSSGFKKE